MQSDHEIMRRKAEYAASLNGLPVITYDLSDYVLVLLEEIERMNTEREALSGSPA